MIERFFTTFKTSGQALSMQRQRVSIASENIANAQTTRTGSGGPYRPKSLLITRSGQTSFERMLKSKVHFTENDQLPGIGRADNETQNLAPDFEIVESEKFRYEYDPAHPDADENGMVKYPGVDLIEEMTRLVMANRLYEANLNAIEAEKEIIKRSFEI